MLDLTCSTEISSAGPPSTGRAFTPAYGAASASVGATLAARMAG